MPHQGLEIELSAGTILLILLVDARKVATILGPLTRDVLGIMAKLLWYRPMENINPGRNSQFLTRRGFGLHKFFEFKC